MSGKIALPIALYVELGHPARATHRILEDAREDCPALPGHVLREADVHREEASHDRIIALFAQSDLLDGQKEAGLAQRCTGSSQPSSVPHSLLPVFTAGKLSLRATALALPGL